MRIRKKQEELIEVVDREERKETLWYHFDDMALRNGILYLRGWHVSVDGPGEVRLTDASGEEISGVSWMPQGRPDLETAFPDENAVRCGFTAQIPREALPAGMVTAEFSNASSVKKEEIPLRRLDRENTRLGKLCSLLRQNGKKKNLELIRQNGLMNYCRYLDEETREASSRYAFYAQQKAPSKKELEEQKKENMKKPPLLSIAAVLWETDAADLSRFVSSLQAQSYGNWQLCLADVHSTPEVSECLSKLCRTDRRILCRHPEQAESRAQAWNEALSFAEGAYVALAAPDGSLSPDALYEAVRYARKHPGTDFFYSDEDLTDRSGHPMEPMFKPDFDPDFLCSRNYIGRLVFLKKAFLDQMGGMDPAYDGAEEFEFLLRCSEKTEKAGHIARVLWHGSWEKALFLRQQGRMSLDAEAGRRALLAHYERLGQEAEVKVSVEAPVFETIFAVRGNPLVSILIPNKDHREDLEKCVTSVEEKSTWKNKELLILENNSTDPSTFEFYEELEKRYDDLRIVRYEGSFNYSAINNLGTAFAKGEYLLLLNNDTEVITPDWIERMLGYCQRTGTSAAGARLFYPDDTLQHGGVTLGIGGVAGHTDQFCRRSDTGMLDHIASARQTSAVTGACMMIRKSAYTAVGGLDETLQVAFNDVDLCLKLRAEGGKILYVPSAQLYHYESKSRGYEDTPEKVERFRSEIRIVSERHRKALAAGDPFYNPNLTLEKNDCSPALLYDLKEKPDEEESTDDRGEGTVQPD